MVYVDEGLDVVEDVECVQVDDAGYVDEVLEEIKDLDVVHVVDSVVDETDVPAEEN